jgi:hypothetical protein
VVTHSVEVSGKRRLVSLKPADTNEATIYTASKYGATVLTVAICNNTAGAIAATLRWSDTSATTDYDILAAKSVPANDTYFISDFILVLRDTDLIKVTSAAGDALTFTLLIAEPHSAMISESSTASGPWSGTGQGPNPSWGNR